MTEIFFAYNGSSGSRESLKKWDWETHPLNMLVAMPYINNWRKHRQWFSPKATMLDSGAFSAWKSNKEITLDEVLEESLTGGWDEAVVLDVIGDPYASVENALAMRLHNPRLIPVFHFGDPWEHLALYVEKFGRVGLSCRFGEPEEEALRWLDQCFARYYPTRFHSFGWVKEKTLMRFPFATADTASFNNPHRFGTWKVFGGNIGHEGWGDIRAEIEFYVKIQTRLRARWRNEFEQQGWEVHG